MSCARPTAGADLGGTAARRALDLALEARACNLLQGRLLFDPSPEADSLLELPAVARGEGASERLVALMASLCRRVIASNGAEGQAELELAGLLDGHAARQRRLPAADRLTVKAIAARVRGPLAVLVDPAAHDGVAYYRACCAVRDVVAACPPEQLLSPALAHELRGRKHALLGRLARDAQRPRDLVA